jgi:hypothetical protein
VLQWDAQVLGTDRFGTWLSSAAGDVHRKANGDALVLPSDGVQLLPANGWWTAWWWRTRKWISVDICTPPVLSEGGWSYVDLELDLARLADGTVMVVDEDEFAHAVAEGVIPEGDAVAARGTAAELQGRLADPSEPVVAAGWAWLDLTDQSALS